jgi:hypothetical protein
VVDATVERVVLTLRDFLGWKMLRVGVGCSGSWGQCACTSTARAACSGGMGSHGARGAVPPGAGAREKPALGASWTQGMGVRLPSRPRSSGYLMRWDGVSAGQVVVGCIGAWRRRDAGPKRVVGCSEDSGPFPESINRDSWLS